MKPIVAILCLVLLASCSDGLPDKTILKIPAKDTLPLQSSVTNPYVPVDLSPMDMSYLPDDYPVLKMTGKIRTQPVARIIYSRPHRQGRKIFGNLLKYGEPWRLGANEATEIDIFQPVSVENKNIPVGRYVLYCIPEEGKWTIVFNSNLDCWGLQQEPSKDLYKFTVPVQVRNQSVEYFSMVFQKTLSGADLVMAWDNVEARLPFKSPSLH